MHFFSLKALPLSLSLSRSLSLSLTTLDRTDTHRSLSPLLPLSPSTISFSLSCSLTMFSRSLISKASRLSSFSRSIPSVSLRAFHSSPSLRLSPDMSLGLTEDQKMFQDMALDFAANEMKPHAEKWDAEKIFPVDTLRKAGEALSLSLSFSLSLSLSLSPSLSLSLSLSLSYSFLALYLFRFPVVFLSNNSSFISLSLLSPSLPLSLSFSFTFSLSLPLSPSPSLPFSRAWLRWYLCKGRRRWVRSLPNRCGHCL